MSKLDGKVALVTGGARGIGRAVCEAFVREGSRVAVADLLMEEAKETARALGDRAIAVEMDVADGQSALLGLQEGAQEGDLVVHGDFHAVTEFRPRANTEVARLRLPQQHGIQGVGTRSALAESCTGCD